MTMSSKAKKRAKREINKDPDFYSKLSKKATKPRGGKNSLGSFKPGDPRQSTGGKNSKRGSLKDKRVSVEYGSLTKYKPDYEDLEP